MKYKIQNLHHNWWWNDIIAFPWGLLSREKTILIIEWMFLTRWSYLLKVLYTLEDVFRNVIDYPIDKLNIFNIFLFLFFTKQPIFVESEYILIPKLWLNICDMFLLQKSMHPFIPTLFEIANEMSSYWLLANGMINRMISNQLEMPKTPIIG